MAKDWNGLITDVATDVRRLDYVTRYSSIPVIFPETVATHSYWVSMYSVIIHRELTPSFPDIERSILLYALTHDAGECVTGDLVRTFKYSDKRLKDAIDMAEEKLVDDLPARVRSLFASVAPSEVGPDFGYVKDIIKAADFLSLTLYMNREIMRGNREIEPFFERMEKDLDAQADGLLARAGQAPYLEDLAGVYRAMRETARNLHRMRIV